MVGETGAGKSVIISALTMALGGRALAEHVRTGQNKAIIEAVFQIDDNHPVFKFLDSIQIEYHSAALTTRREIAGKGGSRCFINDSLVQVSQLKQFGELISDFHGQHDNQIILKPENHVSFIDSLIPDSSLFSDYQAEYNNQLKLISEYSSILKQERDLKMQYDAFDFELNEIKKISPQQNELNSLEKELRILENSELLVQNLNNLKYALTDNEQSVESQLNTSVKSLDKITEFDEKFSIYTQELKSLSITIQEISKFVNEYLNNVEFSSERIEEIRIRILALNGLKKKYGSYTEIFERIEFLEKQIMLSENFEDEIEKLKNKILNSKSKLGLLASSISTARKSNSEVFVNKLLLKLNDLNLKNSKFIVNISEQEIGQDKMFESVSCTIDGKEYLCTTNGYDKVEFLISTNKGEEPKLLSHVASGGEISRIMLAIKSISADTFSIPILIFDEIDTGISGKVAQKVGMTLKELAEEHQIIAITHLAQIAALSDKVFSVSKNEMETNTIISARAEDDESKLVEIAKLISGKDITESSLKTVSELLTQTNNK